MTDSTDSRPVSSSQAGVHPRLEKIVLKHRDQPWQKPVHLPTVEAFRALEHILATRTANEGVILDSGCGTGTSTRQIAARNPGKLVIGLDRSLHRLRKTGHSRFPTAEGNIIWLRADLPAFWVLAANAGWTLQKHWLLYPNPYPKAGHVQRRWHGHPVFPIILSLGGELELRSNWYVYLGEFALAVESLTSFMPVIETLNRPDSGSRFEAKYHHSGQQLFRLTVPAVVLDQWRKSRSVRP